jgi:flagellar basal body-associated protein FliL
MDTCALNEQSNIDKKNSYTTAIILSVVIAVLCLAIVGLAFVMWRKGKFAGFKNVKNVNGDERTLIAERDHVPGVPVVAQVLNTRS